VRWQLRYPGLRRHNVIQAARRGGYIPAAARRRWTASEDDFLRTHWQRLSRAEIAATLGRSVPSVGLRGRRLQLGRHKGDARTPRCRRRDGVLGAAGCAPDPSTCCGSPVSRYGDSARYAARDPGEGDVVRTQARQRGLEGHDPASRLRARVSAQENLWLSTLGWPKAPA